MKKILSVLTVLGVVAMLFACTNSLSSASSNDPAKTSVAGKLIAGETIAVTVNAAN